MNFNLKFTIFILIFFKNVENICSGQDNNKLSLTRYQKIFYPALNLNENEKEKFFTKENENLFIKITEEINKEKINNKYQRKAKFIFFSEELWKKIRECEYYKKLFEFEKKKNKQESEQQNFNLIGKSNNNSSNLIVGNSIIQQQHNNLNINNSGQIIQNENQKRNLEYAKNYQQQQQQNKAINEQEIKKQKEKEEEVVNLKIKDCRDWFLKNFLNSTFLRITTYMIKKEEKTQITNKLISEFTKTIYEKSEIYSLIETNFKKNNKEIETSLKKTLELACSYDFFPYTNFINDIDLHEYQFDSTYEILNGKNKQQKSLQSRDLISLNKLFELNQSIEKIINNYTKQINNHIKHRNENLQEFQKKLEEQNISEDRKKNHEDYIFYHIKFMNINFINFIKENHINKEMEKLNSDLQKTEKIINSNDFKNKIKETVQSFKQDLSQKIEEFKKNNTYKLQEINEDKEYYSENINAIKENSKNKKSLSEIKYKIEKISKNIKSDKYKIEEINEKIKNNQEIEEIEKLQMQINLQEQDSLNLKQESENINQSIKKFEVYKKNKQDNIKLLTYNLKDLNKKISEIKKEKTVIQKKIEYLNDDDNENNNLELKENKKKLKEIINPEINNLNKKREYIEKKMKNENFILDYLESDGYLIDQLNNKLKEIDIEKSNIQFIINENQETEIDSKYLSHNYFDYSFKQKFNFIENYLKYKNSNLKPYCDNENNIYFKNENGERQEIIV